MKVEGLERTVCLSGHATIGANRQLPQTNTKQQTEDKENNKKQQQQQQNQYAVNTAPFHMILINFKICALLLSAVSRYTLSENPPQDGSAINFILKLNKNSY